MVNKKKDLVDLDILIKAYRGDIFKQKNPEPLKSSYIISVITACELLNGAKSINRRGEMNKALRFYTIKQVADTISKPAFSLYKKYSFVHSMQIADAFSAAITVSAKLLLYTDNNSDFNFMRNKVLQGKALNY